MELSRRDLLKLGLLGTAALYLPVERMARASDVVSTARMPTPYAAKFVRPPDINLMGDQRPLQLKTMPMTFPNMLGSDPAAKTTLWGYAVTDPNHGDRKSVV